MKELVAKINAEFEASNCRTKVLPWAKALQRVFKKLLKEFRKLSIEESKIPFTQKSLTKMRDFALIQLVVSRWNLLRA
jgi:hypothetical protein